MTLKCIKAKLWSWLRGWGGTGVVSRGLSVRRSIRPGKSGADSDHHGSLHGKPANPYTDFKILKIIPPENTKTISKVSVQVRDGRLEILKIKNFWE